MKKEYISPIIGAEIFRCGTILTGSASDPTGDLSIGQGDNLQSDAPKRRFFWGL